jgi:YidC/Oxa1 family membrane protein insertase
VILLAVANVFQALQTFLLTREALPENLQKILDQQLAQQAVTVSAAAGGGGGGGDRLPFEPKGRK